MMSVLRSLALWLLVGVLGAGLVHGASLLMLPMVADETAYDRLADAGPDQRFNILPGPGPDESLLPFEDPSFIVAACRYDLDTGMVRVQVPMPTSLAIVSFYTRFGQVFYSLTDRATPSGSADVLILGQSDVGLAQGSSGSESLRIVSPTRVGFVLLRLFVPSRGMRASVNALAQTARCETLPR
jgi:uncharacterized membrane protein